MVINMNLLRKNQVIIYTVALMLVTAGYLNYTSNISKNAIETSVQDISQDNIVNESIEEDINYETANSSSEDVKEVETKNSEDDKKKVETKNGDDDKKEDDNKIADIGDATLVSSNDVVTNYFAKSKLERDSMYSQMIESYEKILNSSNSLETQKQTATQEITKINEIKNKIMICENLIQTKGFENCVVFVNEESASIIIGAEKLKPEEIAQIQNIVSRELNVTIENIHISTK